MRSIPVDSSAFAGFACVMAPEPKMADAETGEVKKDRRTGETVWTVGVCAMRGRDSAVIQVAVNGEPVGVTLGVPLRLSGLEAVPWDRDGRSGIAWRAAEIASLAAPTGAAGPAGRKGGDAV